MRIVSSFMSLLCLGAFLRGVCHGLLLCALLLAWPPGRASAASQPAPVGSETRLLTLGVFAFRPKPVMLERFSELGKYLSGVMKGYRVEIVPMTDTELEQALGTGQVDFILTNPAHYIALREYGQLSGVLSSMVLRDGDAPIHSIGGVILRRQERQGIDRLADLRGKRIAIAGKSFLGTYMAPAAELVRAGVPLEAVTFMETAQPVDQVIFAVLEGRADAGFVRTGLLEQLEREGRVSAGQLAVINAQVVPGFPYRLSTRLYPEWPFLAAAHVSPALSQRLASALLELPPSHPAARQAQIYGFTIPSDYSSVEQAMRDIRMAPFDVQPPLEWSDIWLQYHRWIVALAVAVSLVLMLAVVLAFNTRRLVQLSGYLAADRAQLQSNQMALDRMAHFDPLTGVPNRRLLEDRLHQAVARSRRSGRPLAVLYLDLDDFKPVNDRLGHAMGDRFLIEITRRLQPCLRIEDTLARLGGDEFVVLLVDLQGEDEWLPIVQRIMDQIQRPVTLDEQVVSVSVSVGVTLFPADDADPDTLLRHADQAMYRAKQAGRNRHHLFDMAHDREQQVQQEQLHRLSQALRDQEFVLHYQPQVDLRTGQVLGVEALVRWQHPAQGLLSPALFLPALVGTELEIQLGEWVIETALQQRLAWSSQGIGFRSRLVSASILKAVSCCGQDSSMGCGVCCRSIPLARRSDSNWRYWNRRPWPM
jgi:diguanylate cyclase (GGDEF)-like protein